MTRRLSLLLLPGLLGLSGQALAHDCKCRYLGGEAKQGELRCLKTTEGFRLARCSMVLNNSSWTILKDVCAPQNVSERSQTDAPFQFAVVFPED